MKTVTRWTVVLMLLLTLVVSSAVAEKRAYVVDKNHSQINFVGEALLISAHGFFGKWDADINYDDKAPENSTLAITIDAASINTRVDGRDNHLRSDAFFDVAKYPQVTFTTTKVARQDEKTLMVSGDLTIRGITKPVSAAVKVPLFADGRARFKGEFELNRKEFGMTYNSKMNPIEDIVKVQFDISAGDKIMAEERQRQRQQQGPPPTKPPVR